MFVGRSEGDYQNCSVLNRVLKLRPNLVLLRCHFLKRRAVSVGVSVKKSVFGVGVGVFLTHYVQQMLQTRYPVLHLCWVLSADLRHAG